MLGLGGVRGVFLNKWFYDQWWKAWVGVQSGGAKQGWGMVGDRWRAKKDRQRERRTHRVLNEAKFGERDHAQGTVKRIRPDRGYPMITKVD